MSSKALKALHSVESELLRDISNRLMQRAQFLPDWEEAKVVLSPKPEKVNQKNTSICLLVCSVRVSRTWSREGWRKLRKNGGNCIDGSLAFNRRGQQSARYIMCGGK